MSAEDRAVSVSLGKDNVRWMRDYPFRWDSLTLAETGGRASREWKNSLTEWFW
ncbi:MAG: hypothetical protein MUP16_00945 [Sedimentisphaerales bacterium]|nr:hypothetical protein [Sedimentisphaerales bacterium]